MKRFLAFHGCVLALIMRAAMLPAQNTEPRPTANGERIDRIINGLLVPGTTITDFEARPLAERMAHYHTPGVSIAVINNYQIDWARGFGVAEWDRTNPVTETTLFQAGSVSKPIFALAVMRLVQSGRLDLDENVNHYLKSWQVPTNSDGEPKVTLREILGHSAGFSVHGFGGYDRADKTPTLLEVLNGRFPANSPPIEVTFRPGSKFRYSGGGYTVAQQLVIDVAGEPFPKIVRDLVLEPLGMNHSSYEQPLPLPLQPSAAFGHPTNNQPVPGGWHVYPEMAAAGLWTTPSDLARAGIELQRTLNGAGGGFLSTNQVAAMLKPAVGGQVGISFFLSGRGRSARFGHDGSNAGFLSKMIFYQHGGLGAVILINSNEGGDLLNEIERAIAREYDWPDYFPKKRAATTIPADAFTAFIGTYKRRSGETLLVRRDGDKFKADMVGKGSAEIFPETETNFFATSINAQFIFTKNDHDQVTGVTVLTPEADFVLTKISDRLPLTHIATEIDPALYDAFLGRYELESNRMVTVIRDGDRLLAEVPGHHYVEFWPESGTNFFARAADVQLTFLQDDHGVVTDLILQEPDRDSPGKKLPSVAAKPADNWADLSPHQEHLVEANGIKLCYLDWGGEGDTLLFLAGLGDAAHIFDDFAPRFTNHFRVLALSRRGFGKSAKPGTGYDIGTLTEDIRQLLDALKIDRVILAGHSIAGAELTRFAGRYPGRVLKLVYLDAAYDHSTDAALEAMTPPRDPEPPPEISTNVPALMQWCRTNRLAWSDARETSYRDTRLLTPDGYSVQGSTPDIAYRAILKSAREAPPDYARISAPALAIYAVEDRALELWLSRTPNATKADRDNAEAYFNLLKTRKQEQIARFRKLMKLGRVVEMPDTAHHCFIQRPDEVARAMQAFLTEK